MDMKRFLFLLRAIRFYIKANQPQRQVTDKLAAITKTYFLYIRGKLQEELLYWRIYDDI